MEYITYTLIRAWAIRYGLDPGFGRWYNDVLAQWHDATMPQNRCEKTTLFEAPLIMSKHKTKYRITFTIAELEDMLIALEANKPDSPAIKTLRFALLRYENGLLNSAYTLRNNPSASSKSPINNITLQSDLPKEIQDTIGLMNVFIGFDQANESYMYKKEQRREVEKKLMKYIEEDNSLIDRLPATMRYLAQTPQTGNIEDKI